MNEIQKKYQKEIEEIVEACHRCAELGYVTSSGGNLSYRLSDGNILITPTKTPKLRMKFEDICVIDEKGNEVFFPDGKKPTGEMPFHIRIMNARKDVKAIVHAHPPVITGFAIARSDLLSKAILPEPVIEVGPMLNVGYATPLSEELSQNFDAVIHKSNAFVMENHGALVCSVTTLTDAVDYMEMYEAMAKSIVVSKIIGKVNLLTKEDVSELNKVSKTRNLAIPGGDNTKNLLDIYNNMEVCL